MRSTRTFDSNGKLHSFDDQPAIVWPCGSKAWYHHGVQERGNNYSLIRYHADGEWVKCWTINGIADRVDGPAWEYSDGSTVYFKDGRRNGKSTYLNSKNKIWRIAYYQNGKLHKTDGPAVIEDGRSEWWLYDIQFKNKAKWEKALEILAKLEEYGLEVPRIFTKYIKILLTKEWVDIIATLEELK